jgi:signal transduction histidine kinase
VQADLRAITGAARHLLGLVDDILDLSRVEANRLEFEPVDVPVRGLLQRALDGVQVAAASRGNALHLQVDPRLDTVRTDARRGEQILLNLLSNAVKFTDRGRIELIAEVGPTGAQLRVTDTGIGIAADDLRRLFQRFGQLDDSPTRTRGGAGLGLALSRELARRMGGDLVATSRPGVGSSFVWVVVGRGPTDPEAVSRSLQSATPRAYSSSAPNGSVNE